jgi:hypothetical protein
MNINNILEKLRKYKKIYVTGPQRSGTTFTAKYLSKTLGYKHIDEHDFGTHDFNSMVNVVKSTECFVIQCPAQTHNILNFPMDNDSIVVFMIRDVYDIITSEHRIDWHQRGAEGRERKKYMDSFNKYTKPYLPISIIKYKVWDDIQKPSLNNYLELSYDLLKTTDMWIDKDKRKNFKNKQTE